MEVEALIQLADTAKSNAYSRYSNYPVGAAILGNNGKVYTGCNVDNCAYPVSWCAERTAIGNAVSDGCKSFDSVAVIS